MALSDNLISYWELNEAVGIRNDSHGSNHLTDNNTVTSTTGKVGTAALFTRANTEYLSRADNASLSAAGNIDLTVAAWVKLTSKPDDMTILVKGDADDCEYQLVYRFSSDRFAFAMASAGSLTNLTEVTANNFGSPSTGTWYFVVGWHDSVADTINIQINNGTADSTAYSFGSYDSTAPLEIGTDTFYGEWWDGAIDQVGFWKRVLTIGERTSLYNSGNGLSYAEVIAATIKPRFLTSGSGNFTGSSVSTASITPSSNRLVLAVICAGYDVNPGTNHFSLSGNGLTWVRVQEFQWSTIRLMGVFRAMGISPSAGAVTISSDSSATEANATWAIMEFSGVDASGTNGSGAIGSTPVTGTVDGLSLGITITGTPGARDITFAGFTIQDGSTDLAGDALWMNLADSGDFGDTRSRAECDTGQDLTPTWTWVTTTRQAGVIGFIIKATQSEVLLNNTGIQRTYRQRPFGPGIAR